MTKLKKSIITCLAVVLMFAAMFAFAGCDLLDKLSGNNNNSQQTEQTQDANGNENQNNDSNQNVTLQNGHYRVDVSTMDGASQTSEIGRYFTVNNTQLVDDGDYVSTYTITGNTIYLNIYGEQVVTGTVTETSISLDYVINGHRYVMTLNYVADVALQNGNYRIDVSTMNGVSQTAEVGQYVTVNNGTITDAGDHVSTYTITGNTIYLNLYGEQVVTGTVTETSISLEYEVNNQQFVMVFNKVA